MQLSDVKKNREVCEKILEQEIKDFEKALPEEIVIENVIITRLPNSDKLVCKINLKMEG